MLIGLVIALGVVLADQISKNMIFELLLKSDGMLEVTPFFNLVAAWNTGVSFSMFNNLGGNGVYILSAFSLCIVVFLIYWLLKEEKKSIQIALGMVIGGAVGNVIDRVHVGAVFDFLDVHYKTYHWPAFNIADSFICIGAAIIICSGLFSRNELKKEVSEESVK